jgi:hypothetical protein
MSVIIDGMDQNNSKLPYLGQQSAFKNPLKQSITGIKEHGIGLTLYRTVDSITKGADLSIHCLLLQIEAWKARNDGRYPDEIYVQCDGGSENANQYFLGMLELLVVKRMARLVVYSRLPTGHTHEDIDAGFGAIKGCCFNRKCETFEDYVTQIEDYFSGSRLNVSVKDIYVVPDYQRLFTDCLDPHVSKLHKEIYTQHQWRFEAVVCSPYFPLGAKATFRAYCSDVVTELKKKPKHSCCTEMGQYTGLEPVKLHCTWFPSMECDEDRPGTIFGIEFS